MIQLGSFLVLLGMSSSVLAFVEGYEMNYFTWVNNWGTSTAWAIRIFCVLLGITLATSEIRKNKRKATIDSLPSSKVKQKV